VRPVQDLPTHIVQIDDRPLALGAPTLGDYWSTALLQLYVRNPFTATHDGPRVEARLGAGESPTFDDGEAVSGRHLVNAIQAVMTSENPVARLLEPLRTIAYDATSVRLELERPTPVLAELLQTIDFAPSSADCYVPGRYHAPWAETSSLEFEPRHADQAPLRFVIEPDPSAAIESYERGEVTTTCPFSFPAGEAPEYLARPDCHSVDLGVRYHLEFSRSRELSGEQRRWLAGLIDPVAACRGVEALTTPIPACRSEMPGEPRSRQDRALVIGYHDYYPNELVATNLAQLWEDAGAAVEVRVVAFDEQTEHEGVDALLVLRFETVAGDALLLEQYAALTAQDSVRLLFWGAAGGSRRDRVALAALFRDDPWIIPLAKLGGLYLTRLEHFRWPERVGRFGDAF
jgi:hypothetical protein